MTFTFAASVAWDPNGNKPVKNVSFQAYATSDAGFTTPLAITDTFGNPIAGNILNSGSQGVFPQFNQATNSAVVITDAAHTYSWTINCVPTDAATANFISTGGSATNNALANTYTPKWLSGTAYSVNQVIVNPTGDLVRCTTAHTSTGSYDSTKFQVNATDSSGATAAALSATYVPAVVVQGFTNAAVHAARDKAGVGGSVFFPAGSYSVNGLLANVSGQTWTFAPGVILTLAANSNTDLIQITASNVTVQGRAVLDGNATGNTTGGSGGILVNATGAVLNDFTLQNGRQVGINIVRSRTRVNNVTVTNMGDAGIAVVPADTVTAISDISIERCTVTNTVAGPYGIRVHGNTVAATVRVQDNHINLPATSSSGLGIELFGRADKSSATGNTVIGSRIGISVSGSYDNAVTGNVIDGANLYGIECAGGINTAISGNIVNGEAVTSYGVSISATAKYVAVAGNAIQNWLASTGNGIHSGGSDHVTITGNTLNGPAQPIILQTTTKFSVQNNVLNGQGTANDGVNLDGCTDGIVASNVFDSFTRSGVIVFNGAMTNLTVGPNTLAGTTPNVPLYMSAAIGAGSIVNCGNMTTAARTNPTYAGVGGTYFDTTTNKAMRSDGTNWQEPTQDATVAGFVNSSASSTAAALRVQLKPRGEDQNSLNIPTDGVSDCKAALNAIPAGTGRVFLNGTFLTSGQVVTQSGVELVGVDRSKTTIKAGPGFAGSSVVQLGTSSTAFDTGLTHMAVDAAGLADIAISALNIQELCGLDHVLVTNWLLGGVDFSASQNQNYDIRTVELYGKPGAVKANSFGIKTGAGVARLIESITVINAGVTNTAAPAGSSGIILQSTGSVLHGLHFEGCVWGLDLNGATGSVIGGVTGSGGIGIVTDLVHVRNVGQNGIKLSGLFPNGSTNTINDLLHGYTNAGVISTYDWGNGAAGQETLFSTAYGAANRIQGSLTTTGNATAANYSWTGGSNTFSGSGAPAIAGTAGDFYFRKDTPATANQRIYVCTVAGGAGAATWVGIA